MASSSMLHSMKLAARSLPARRMHLAVAQLPDQFAGAWTFGHPSSGGPLVEARIVSHRATQAVPTARFATPALPPHMMAQEISPVHEDWYGEAGAPLA
jgi:hypothetical protein